jgi:hypothetical protein
VQPITSLQSHNQEEEDSDSGLGVLGGSAGQLAERVAVVLLVALAVVLLVALAVVLLVALALAPVVGVFFQQTLVLYVPWQTSQEEVPLDRL